MTRRLNTMSSMLAGARGFSPSSRSFATGRTLRLLLACIGLAIGVNTLVLFDWTYVENLPNDILGKHAFHPKPFVPLPHDLDAQADNGLDFWTWNTMTQFIKIKYSEWRDGSTDECALFPVHLLSKIQVILKTGSADDKSRTDAQLPTVIKCISNVLIVSDGNHTYGRDHQAIDVLADLPPNTYLTPEDYVIYEAQKNASRQGTKLQQGHEGWRLDRYNSYRKWKKRLITTRRLSGTFSWRATPTSSGTMSSVFWRTITAHCLTTLDRLNLEENTILARIPKPKSKCGSRTEAPASFFPRPLRIDSLIDPATPLVSRVLVSPQNTKKTSGPIVVATAY